MTFFSAVKSVLDYTKEYKKWHFYDIIAQKKESENNE